MSTREHLRVHRHLSYLSDHEPTTPKETPMNVLIAILCLVTLLSAHPALAERPHGGPGFPGPGPGGPPAGRLLERLIDPCRPACFDTARNCHDTAEAEALTSAQSSCASEIQTAQSACATNRAAQACRTAVSALRTCAQPSLTSFRSAVSACHNTVETCVEACDSGQ